MYLLARLNVDAQAISVAEEYKSLKVTMDSSPLKAAFAAKRAQLVINGMRAVDEDSLKVQAKSKPKLKTNTKISSALPNVLQVLHPSPASPAANRGWAPQIDRALAHVWSP